MGRPYFIDISSLLDINRKKFEMVSFNLKLALRGGLYSLLKRRKHKRA